MPSLGQLEAMRRGDLLYVAKQALHELDQLKGLKDAAGAVMRVNALARKFEAQAVDESNPTAVVAGAIAVEIRRALEGPQ